MQDQDSSNELNQKLDSYLQLNRDSWSALSSIDQLIQELHQKTFDNKASTEFKQSIQNMQQKFKEKKKVLMNRIHKFVYKGNNCLNNSLIELKREVEKIQREENAQKIQQTTRDQVQLSSMKDSSFEGARQQKSVKLFAQMQDQNRKKSQAAKQDSKEEQKNGQGFNNSNPVKTQRVSNKPKIEKQILQPKLVADPKSKAQQIKSEQLPPNQQSALTAKKNLKEGPVMKKTTKPKFSFIVSQDQKKGKDQQQPIQDDNIEYVEENNQTQNQKQKQSALVFSSKPSSSPFNARSDVFASKMKQFNLQRKQLKKEQNVKQDNDKAKNLPEIVPQPIKTVQIGRQQKQDPFNLTPQPIKQISSNQQKQPQTQKENPFTQIKSRWNSRENSNQIQQSNQKSSFELIAMQQKRNSSQQSESGTNSLWSQRQQRSNWISNNNNSRSQKESNTSSSSIWAKRPSQQANKFGWKNDNSFPGTLKQNNQSSWSNLRDKKQDPFGKRDNAVLPRSNIFDKSKKSNKSFLDDPSAWSNRDQKATVDQDQDLFRDNATNITRRRW